jgi:hypothetical protein
VAQAQERVLVQVLVREMGSALVQEQVLVELEE